MDSCRKAIVWALVITAFLLPSARSEESPADYSAVDALFAKHCLDCHASQEPDGKLILETYTNLMQGGESGRVIVPGRSSESLIVRAVEVGLDRDGKKKLMPPGKREKLKPDEITTLKRWIDAGAPAPKTTPRPLARDVVVPKIKPSVPPPRAIRSAAYSQSLKLVALARHAEVELVSLETRQVVRRLTELRGAVNALTFSKDGNTLAVASGEPALFGQATLWNAADGRLLRTIEGHNDALYAIAISPDGSRLATGSYDQKIKLWNPADGELVHTLSAHNAAIYCLAFRPDGKILASASGDRTVKLWQVASGKRVETLSQPLRDILGLAWNPNGKRLAAASADNRIRVWEISDTAAETTNPLLISKFAHEGSLLNVAWSPDGKTLVSSADDQTIKLWDADQVSERRLVEKQSDLAPALAFLGDGRQFLAGRMDGTWDIFDTEKGTRVPPPAPGLSKIQPRGITPGGRFEVKLFGTNLAGITNVRSSDARIAPTLLSTTSNAAFVRLETTNSLPRGAYELWVLGPGGDSGRVKVYVDNVPQSDETAGATLAQLPVAVWGVLDQPGNSDEYRFPAQANETVVVELATRSVGSKIQNAAISVMDAQGSLLATDGGFDGGDRAIAFKAPSNGTFMARVSDQMMNASADHIYRLTIGVLPLVMGIFPLSVPTNSTSRVRLIGHNLPPEAHVPVLSGNGGEVEVPISSEQFRALKTFKVLAAAGEQPLEIEPNDKPSQATPVPVPAGINARMDRSGDVDLFQFTAKRQQLLILETDAARRGTDVDTRIEILSEEGQPVPRLLLQAVRNTAINFRGIDSNGTGMRLDNYEEMELNEYLYINGDVMRLFRMPQGPDSDMLMFASAGKRRAYFDTTAVAHALDEQGFIVQPHPLGTKLVPNGLPTFTLHYENDDEAERKLGSDSKVAFTAPADGKFLARVTDTRGHGGETMAYRLIIREARPDFTVTLAGANPTIAAGSGQSFTLNAERADGFEGEIRVEMSGLPPGFTVSSPLVIEEGQVEAKGTIFAAADAPKPDATNGALTKITATATINKKLVVKDVGNFGTIKLGAAPKLYVALEPYTEAPPKPFDPSVLPDNPLELTITPGETIPAWLKIARHGHKDLVTFFAENLPHGVIVADIGLNGVLIPKEENERKIFFNAAKWVPKQERLFYMIEQQAGRQTSRPVLLKVK
jgi:WD40 repeat protein